MKESGRVLSNAATLNFPLDGIATVMWSGE